MENTIDKGENQFDVISCMIPLVEIPQFETPVIDLVDDSPVSQRPAMPSNADAPPVNNLLSYEMETQALSDEVFLSVSKSEVRASPLPQARYLPEGQMEMASDWMVKKKAGVQSTILEHFVPMQHNDYHTSRK